MLLPIDLVEVIMLATIAIVGATTQSPSDPKSRGVCKYAAVCGLTDPCKKPQACLPQEQAMCDRVDNDHFCHCATPTAQDVPVTPTTDAPTTDTPTTGPLTTGDKP